MDDGRKVRLRTVWTGLRSRWAPGGARLMLCRRKVWQVLIDPPHVPGRKAQLVPVSMTEASMVAAERIGAAVAVDPGERVDIDEVGVYVVSENHTAGGWGLNLERVS